MWLIHGLSGRLEENVDIFDVLEGFSYQYIISVHLKTHYQFDPTRLWALELWFRLVWEEMMTQFYDFAPSFAIQTKWKSIGSGNLYVALQTHNWTARASRWSELHNQTRELGPNLTELEMSGGEDLQRERKKRNETLMYQTATDSSEWQIRSMNWLNALRGEIFTSSNSGGAKLGFQLGLPDRTQKRSHYKFILIHSSMCVASQ